MDLTNLSVNKEQEKRQLQQLFEMDQSCMEKRHLENIQHEKQLLKQEQEQSDKFVNVSNELCELIKRVDVNSHQVNSIHENLTQQQYQLLKSKEDQLEERDKMLSKSERYVQEQNQHLERERIRLTSLFINMENTMQSLQKSYEEERQKCRQDQLKCNQDQLLLTTQHELQTQHIHDLRDQLEKDRSVHLQEKQSFLVSVHHEKTELTKLKNQANAQKESFLYEQAKTLKELNERESECLKLTNSSQAESALLKERKNMIEKEKLILLEEQSKFQVQKEALEKNIQELTKQAMMVQRESENCNVKHQDAIKERLESQRVMGEMNMIKAGFEADKRELEMKRRQLNQEMKNMEAERVRISQMRQEASAEKLQLNSRVDQVRRLEVKLNDQMVMATSMMTTTHSHHQQQQQQHHHQLYSNHHGVEDDFYHRGGGVGENGDDDDDEEYKGLSKSVSSILAKKFKSNDHHGLMIQNKKGASGVGVDLNAASTLKDQLKFLEQITSSNQQLPPPGAISANNHYSSFVKLNQLDSTLKTSSVDGSGSSSQRSSPIDA
ncbi:hypothetical protein AKO1_001100 [Acrasis kona]|uniref:Fas-binding factor 1 C-terminal domain-containing protein n=1 Tax=Acrasis kona TaxID=1008807 RepID=A0AAW2ZD63_9EUKA